MDTTADVEPSQRVPILLLTGFLGSGKTTLLNHLVKQPAFGRALVLINEFGEIGLDHHLMTHSTEGAVVEMSSGCLCCTIQSDLATTLKGAPGRFGYKGDLWFDRVVIETTGLADPVPIIHTLMSEPDVAARYRLETVVATVDALNADVTLDEQIESVKQAAMADQLLLTKTDLADERAVLVLQARLRALNPLASITKTGRGIVGAGSPFGAEPFDVSTKSAEAQQWLAAEAISNGPHHAHEHHDVNRHDARIKAFCLTLDEPLQRTVLNRWFNELLKLRGADLLRVKGLVNVRGMDGPVVVHGVQHAFHPPVELDTWPDEDDRTRIVFITRGIEDSLLRATLEAARQSELEQPTNASPEDGPFVLI